MSLTGVYANRLTVTVHADCQGATTLTVALPPPLPQPHCAARPSGHDGQHDGRRLGRVVAAAGGGRAGPLLLLRGCPGVVGVVSFAGAGKLAHLKHSKPRTLRR